MTEEKVETQKTELALAKQTAFGEKGLQVNSLEQASLVARTFISSGLVPKSFDSPAKVIVAIQAGREMGFGLFESLTKLHVVNGRVGMEAKAMKAKALQSGKCKSWKEEKIGVKGEDDEGYRITVERSDGQSGSVEFIWQEAVAAGLDGKDTYKKYADDMLWNRAVAKACRRWFDDIIFGVYTPEELVALPPEDSPQNFTETEKTVSEKVSAEMGQKPIEADFEQPHGTEVVQIPPSALSPEQFQEPAKPKTKKAKAIDKASQYYCELCKANFKGDACDSDEKGIYHSECGYEVSEIK